MTSSLPCWWMKTKDLLLASFARPPEVLHSSIVIGVSEIATKTLNFTNKIINLYVEGGLT